MLAATTTVLLLLAAPAAAKTWTIEVEQVSPSDGGVQFVPRDLTIAVGDTVRWIDNEPGGHTATSPAAGFDHAFSGQRGEAFSFTFDDAGTFAYHCKPHDWMTGTITVATAGDDPGTSSRTATGTSTTATATTPDGEEGAPAAGFATALLLLGLAAAMRRRPR